LKTIIDSFEKAKEWSDLSNSLNKLKKLFERFPIGPIPEMHSLAKRLCKSI